MGDVLGILGMSIYNLNGYIIPFWIQLVRLFQNDGSRLSMLLVWICLSAFVVCGIYGTILSIVDPV